MEDLEQYVREQPLPTEVFFALVEATVELIAVSDKYWHSQGLSGARIRILVEIVKEGGTILPSELARRIGVTKSNISLLLAPLEKSGYILRGSDQKDGRKSVISIADQGRSLLGKYLPGNRQAIEAGMKPLETAEMQQLMLLLRKLQGSGNRE
ncbi:MarR family winged helix-turn-helix transcriptional regulator [Paenibacillus donghaensis]|uniref:MarR family transcriptional regulator n=1 Tax=Paenibacillus donghaensis TaxID=414771 RepID=A0A2Z2K877_9BACL|nr:MarR family transcriptional regulator [Paenibacillus donghaensis]ASA21407.1 MarR family transcriptional regulator [Paenibacillus donghaensis]